MQDFCIEERRIGTFRKALLFSDMQTVRPQYITDNTGKKVSVVIPLKDFKAMLKELGELEDIRLYDEAKKSKVPSIPIDKAFKMIEAKRKSK